MSPQDITVVVEMQKYHDTNTNMETSISIFM